ncbi:BrnT family toxin [Bdellovibrionales bacterium]|nr:BrnT family toxin [Bdellovibrionales bacterium]
MLHFFWDPKKNTSNQKKHKISFEEAQTCFYDPMHILISDPDHSESEERMILLGTSSKSSLLVVVHVDIADGEVRIITARKATKLERNQYEEV